MVKNSKATVKKFGDYYHVAIAGFVATWKFSTKSEASQAATYVNKTGDLSVVRTNISALERLVEESPPAKRAFAAAGALSVKASRAVGKLFTKYPALTDKFWGNESYRKGYHGTLGNVIDQGLSFDPRPRGEDRLPSEIRRQK